MREHKHRCVIRRLFAPPAFPTVVGPWASHWSEHISTKDEGANVFKALLGDVVIYICLTLFIAVHALKGSSRKEPIKHSGTANADWVLKILVWPSAKPIK